MAKIHTIPEDDNCSICQHEHRDVIEEFYLRWKTNKEIIAGFGVTPNDLRRHIDALDLKNKRMGKRRHMIAELIDRKWQDIKVDEIPWSEITKLIKHLDVVDGLVVHKIRAERPELVMIPLLPAPGPEYIQITGDVEETDDEKD